MKPGLKEVDLVSVKASLTELVNSKVAATVAVVFSFELFDVVYVVELCDVVESLPVRMTPTVAVVWVVDFTVVVVPVVVVNVVVLGGWLSNVAVVGAPDVVGGTVVYGCCAHDTVPTDPVELLEPVLHIIIAHTINI